jgi:uncharacterized protein YjbI with pentapeptide repeats
MARHEPIEAADVSRAVLSDAMLRERRLVVTRLKAMGVNVVDADLDQINMRLLDTYLALKHGRN